MEECGNCKEKAACVPFFAHENVLMHYNRANRRMLIALARDESPGSFYIQI